MTDAEVADVFAAVLGADGAAAEAVAAARGYLGDLAARTQFSKDDFAPLLPAFTAYMDQMADDYFKGSRLQYLAFLDIVAAKGNEWPHFTTNTHNIRLYIKDGMGLVDLFLKTSGHSAGAYTKDDILAGIKADTQKDHAGFFEFWSGMGFDLDPTKWKEKTTTTVATGTTGTATGTSGTAGGITGAAGTAGTAGTSSPAAQGSQAGQAGRAGGAGWAGGAGRPKGSAISWTIAVGVIVLAAAAAVRVGALLRRKRRGACTISRRKVAKSGW